MRRGGLIYREELLTIKIFTSFDKEIALRLLDVLYAFQRARIVFLIIIFSEKLPWLSTLLRLQWVWFDFRFLVRKFRCWLLERVNSNTLLSPEGDARATLGWDLTEFSYILLLSKNYVFTISKYKSRSGFLNIENCVGGLGYVDGLE